MKKHRFVWGYLVAVLALICCTAFLPFAAASADEPEGSAPVAVVEDVAEQADPASDGASEQGEGATSVLDSAVVDEATEDDVVAGENADVPATDGEVAAEQSAPASIDVASDVPAVESGEETVADAGYDTPAAGTADDELLPVLPVVDADDMVDIQEVVIEAEKPAARPKKTNGQDVTSPLATADAIATEFTQELKDTIKNRMKYALLDLSKNGPQTLNGSTVNVWKIDLDDLKISKELSSRTFLDLLQEAVRESPDLFYVRTNKITPFSYSTGTYAFLYVYANYEISAIPAMQASYEQQVQNALSWVPDNATELQIVQAIHDYLASTCTYDHDAAASVEEGDALIESGLISSYNAYGALVNKTAVCQGYSAAFNALMSKLGVASDYVTQGVTDQGRHGWNRVRIDGDWYNLDVTWDEDVPASHRYFLKSDGYWTTTGADSRGFHAWWEEDTPAGTNTQYDNKTNWVPYTGPATQTRVTSFALNPSVCGLKVGESANIAITNISPSSACTYGAKWTSSNPSIAAVDATGKVIAGQTAGTTTVTCTINGVSRTCTVNVGLSDNDISTATISAIPDQKFCATSIKPAFTVTHKGVQLTEGTDYTVTYSNNYMPGTATITVKGAGSYTGSVKTSFIITKLDVAKDVRIGNVYSETYTGSAIEQPYLGLFFGTNYQLTKDTHYTVEYENNVNAGTATIRITGIGDLAEGETTTTFTINPRSITANGVSITGIESKEYTGSGVTQNPTITYNDMTLVEGTDYTLDYTNNVNVGSSAKVTINGIGNYTGSTTKTFSITQNSIANATLGSVNTYTYNATAIEPKPSVTLDGKTLIEGTDFTYSYANNVNAGTATVTVIGMGSYAGSKSVDFTIYPRGIYAAAFSNYNTTKTYDGTAQTQNPVATYGGKTLTSDDYSVSYSSNTNAGTATITFIGKGNFNSSTSYTFTINPRSITATTISGVVDKEYTGSAVTQIPTITYNGMTLVENTDYTLSYANNIAKGTATMTVAGKGNYTGSTDRTFNITGPNIAGATIGNVAAQTYTGSEITPKPLVTYNGSTLQENTDYRIEYSNNVNAGTATMKFIGMGNYEGNVSKTFTINKANISLASISTLPSYTYDGQYKTPEPTVTYGGKTLVKDTDYTLGYSNNRDAGEATLTVTGKGNFTGSVSRGFTINPRDISEATIAPIAEQEFDSDYPAQPYPTVTYINPAGSKLDLSSDDCFDISYVDNDKIGTATITLVGKGNWTGTTSTSFEIVDASHAPTNNVLTPDNSWSNPVSMATNGEDPYGNEDIWTITLPSDGLLTLSIQVKSKGVVYGDLLSTNREINYCWMGAYGSSDKSASTTTDTVWLQKGTYLLTTTPWEGEASDSYQIRAKFEAANTSEIEPNDTIAQAQSIPANTKITGFLGYRGHYESSYRELPKDEDYYKFTINEKQRVTFEVYLTHTYSKVAHGELLDSSGNVKQVEFTYDWDTAGEDVDIWDWMEIGASEKSPARYAVTLDKGTYYLRVFPENDSTGAYAVKWTGKVLVTGVKVTGSNSMNVGGTQTLKTTITPTNAANKAVTWKSSDTAIATVDTNGKVTAKKAGTVTITATAKDESKKSGPIKITVNPIKVTSVKVTGNATMNPGQSQTLKATIAPSNATNKAVTWKSSDTAVATVDANGKVTAKKAGTVTITATAKDGSKKAGSIKITVKPKTVPVTSIKVTGPNKATSLKLNPGQSSTLTATVSPSNATNKKVTWTSSNGNVVAVDKNTGKVTAKKAGTATITATAKDESKKSGSIKITVNTPSISYRTHVQNIGWQGWKYNGAMSGTSGMAYRLEGINIDLANKNGGITYRTHVQNIGWQDWKSNGAMSGTSGKAYRLEAIQIKLTGEISKYYDVYYRVHCQNIGWMGWAKNGEQSGTAGYAYRLEGIQIVVMPKGQKPGATVDGIKQATNECFRER